MFWMILMLLGAQISHAQLFSIDINGTVRSDVTAPGFMPWYMAPQVGPGISSATQSFTNFVYEYDSDGNIIATNVGSTMTCTVVMTVPATADSTHYLNANYANKNGNSTSTDPNAGWRLSEDGCWSHWKDDSISVDQPNTNGGALSLTITGLSAGVHTITTYHNDIWGISGGGWHAGITNISRCIISVNGTPVFTNTPSVVATNDSQCGFAFFYVTNSYDGQPVVLNFDPDHSSALDFTILNGFEIDRPGQPGTSATAISPTPGNEHVFANNDVPLPGTANAGYLALQWQPAGFAISNYLYFGTNNQAVANATTASNAYMGASAAVPGTTNSFNVTNLNSMLTYYWRVDQLDIVNGVTNLVKGSVWEFRTRHLAFPTAEGYGRWARGGRGGVVIEVTNLNDSGPGSYRAAIGASGPRTIVFKVSGVIWLQSQCIIGNGYVTIAGQTAPDGICIANFRAGCDSPNDVIMRYMEFRVGDFGEQAMDAMSPSSAHDSIFDHITSSWSLDVACNSLQTSKVGSGQCNASYQHNIISECLNYSYHYNDSERAATGCTNCYQPHAFAASIGGEIGSYHHNLIAHSTDRNWSLAGGLDQSGHLAGSLDIRNNVVYNWTSRTTDGGADRVDYENNYYESYPSNPNCKYLLKTDANDPSVGYGNAGYYYMTGNVMTGVAGQANLFTNNWANGGYENGTSMQAILQTNAELYPSYVATVSASNAYEAVLSDVGCNLPQEDLIDQRVIGEVLNHTVHYEGTNGPTYTINGVVQSDPGPDQPGMIDSQTDVHDYQSTNSSLANYSANAPWPSLNTPYNAADYLDTDNDGLPDWWERIKGLNTNSAPGDFSDANADLVGDGYTELDRYLNWMALPHYDCTNGATLNIDLTQYTRGFTNASLGAVYAVFNASGGNVSLNGKTAQFTPNTGIEALGSFMFAVTDNTGFSYTNTINIHILSDGSTQTVPAIPTNLVATAGNAQVSLSWNSATGATSYHVWRSTTSGSGYTDIATNASTAYTDINVTNGTTYYYVVSAVNSVGESGTSAEVNATPSLALPSVPAGLGATPANQQVALTWTASSGATGYHVWRSTTSGSGYVDVDTNATTAYTDTGLTNGTTYYYVVSAVNAAGESADSSEVNATPRIPAPTGLQATAGNTQVSLTWTASSGAVSYVVKRSITSGSGYVPITTNVATSYMDNGVVNGTTYFYVVAAVDSGGVQSLNSSQIFATPAGSSVGGLIYYDGFNYAGFNTIDLTNNGGTGWNIAWNDKNALTVINAASLGYTDASGNVLVTAGGSIIDTNTSSTATLEPERLFSSSTTVTLGSLAATNSNTLWMSYLWKGFNTGGQGTGGNSYRQATLMFLQGATTAQATGKEYLDLGIPNIDNNSIPADFSLWDANVIAGGTTLNSTSPLQSTVAANTGSAMFVLIQMTVDNVTTTPDTINVWLNPPLGVSSLGTPNLTFSGQDLSAVNAIRFQSSPVNTTYNVGGQMSVDELRLGSSLASVTPYTAGSGNTAPVLAPISNTNINAGVNLVITNSATDADVPAQTLTFSLPVAPTNATIIPANGILNWRPLVTQANTTNPFSVVVTDNGTPNMSATQSFNVVVNPLAAPSAVSGGINNGLFNLIIGGQNGPDYAVQTSSNLINWNTVFITNSPGLPFDWSDTNTTSQAVQFYRVKLGPPLP